MSKLWHEVEKQIHKEILWLKDNIITFDKIKPPSASLEFNKWSTSYYLYRLIAISIVNGKIKAREINSKGNNDLWDGLTKSSGIPIKAKHGKEWHRNMIDVIEKYFKKDGFEVTIEPSLNYGRADLGVFKEGKKNLYVEVGSVSIYKMCINLHAMKDSIFLSIPSEQKIIEFET